MNLIAKLWSNIRPKTQRELEEAYLAESVDLIDLERRIKYLQTHPIIR